MPTNPHAAQDAIIDRAIAASPEYQLAQRDGRAAKWDVTLPNGGVIHVSREAGPNGKINIANRTALQRALMIGPTFIPGAAGVISNLGKAAPVVQAADAGGKAASVGSPAATEAGIYGSQVAAPVAAKSFWDKALPYLIDVGGNVAGSVLNQRAASKAADQQSAAAQQGIDLQKQVWSDIQRNQAPFIQTGQGAITRLNGLMGGSPLNLAQPSAPVASNASPLSLSGTSPIQTVKLKAPDGSVQFVPQNEADHYISRGAVPA